MTKSFIRMAAALLVMTGCEKQQAEAPATPETQKTLHLAVSIVTEMIPRMTASAEENRVVSYDLYLFDAESGLLESYERQIAPRTAALASDGENTIGNIELKVPDSRVWNLLAVANATSQNTTLPMIETGVTTYAGMLKATLGVEANTTPGAPLVMSGSAIGISSESPVSIKLCRRLAKLSVVNGEADNRMKITSVQLKQVSGRAGLFQDGAEEQVYTDYPMMQLTLAAGDAACFYLLPQHVRDNRAELTFEGTSDGKPFSRVIAVQLLDKDGEELSIEANNQYTITLMSEETDPEGTVHFNGLAWMDRNLGATDSDMENAWTASCGSFFQWGRNTAFIPDNYQTLGGPLSAEEAEANKSAFITKMSGDWLSPSDDSLWAEASKQPCPEGYRLPTATELFGIIPSTGVLFNMINGPKIVYAETLPEGNATAHYFGDNSNKTLYGIKRQGTPEAYYLKWEYLKTTEGNAYLKISRWTASEQATFSGKDLAAVRSEFDLFGGAAETLTLPASGYITGSNGAYGDNKGGYYWASTPNGTGAWRVEFTDGKVVMTTPYNSRVSGHSLRCVKI